MRIEHLFIFFVCFLFWRKQTSDAFLCYPKTKVYPTHRRCSLPFVSIAEEDATKEFGMMKIKDQHSCFVQKDKHTGSYSVWYRHLSSKDTQFPWKLWSFSTGTSLRQYILIDYDFSVVISKFSSSRYLLLCVGFYDSHREVYVQQLFQYLYDPQPFQKNQWKSLTFHSLWEELYDSPILSMVWDDSSFSTYFRNGIITTHFWDVDSQMMKTHHDQRQQWKLKDGIFQVVPVVFPFRGKHVFLFPSIPLQIWSYSSSHKLQQIGIFPSFLLQQKIHSFSIYPVSSNTFQLLVLTNSGNVYVFVESFPSSSSSSSPWKPRYDWKLPSPIPLQSNSLGIYANTNYCLLLDDRGSLFILDITTGTEIEEVIFQEFYTHDWCPYESQYWGSPPFFAIHSRSNGFILFRWNVSSSTSYLTQPQTILMSSEEETIPTEITSFQQWLTPLSSSSSNPILLKFLLSKEKRKNTSSNSSSSNSSSSISSSTSLRNQHDDEIPSDSNLDDPSEEE